MAEKHPQRCEIGCEDCLSDSEIVREYTTYTEQRIEIETGWGWRGGLMYIKNTFTSKIL